MIIQRLLTSPNYARMLDHDGEASSARSFIDDIICRDDCEVMIERVEILRFHGKIELVCRQKLRDAKRGEEKIGRGRVYHLSVFDRLAGLTWERG